MHTHLLILLKRIPNFEFQKFKPNKFHRKYPINLNEGQYSNTIEQKTM